MAARYSDVPQSVGNRCVITQIDSVRCLCETSTLLRMEHRIRKGGIQVQIAMHNDTYSSDDMDFDKFRSKPIWK